jgi:hypothetical protein
MTGHAAGMYRTFSELVAMNTIKTKMAGVLTRLVVGAAHDVLQN